MKVLVDAQSKVVEFEYPDNTDFYINQPHGFVELRPHGTNHRSYFNMQYLIALMPSGDAK